MSCEEALAAERAAHAETRKALEYARGCLRDGATGLASTRAELVKAEARVKELEAARAQDRREQALGYRNRG